MSPFIRSISILLVSPRFEPLELPRRSPPFPAAESHRSKISRRRERLADRVGATSLPLAVMRPLACPGKIGCSNPCNEWVDDPRQHGCHDCHQNCRYKMLFHGSFLSLAFGPILSV